MAFLSKGRTETDELHALRTESGITLGGQKTGETLLQICTTKINRVNVMK
jgi:hypothetical protein